MTSGAGWRPTATVDTLKKRAAMMRAARLFFAEREVLEVETPILGACSVTDSYIESLRIDSPQLWLRTSPEYHMKRLLASGCPDLYQLAKVFRAGEAGSRHQPEFTLAEWYRCGFSLDQMIDETGQFIRALFESVGGTLPEKLQLQCYSDAFIKFTGIDPITSGLDEVQQCAAQLSVWNTELEQQLGSDRNAWLDLIASHAVYPALPRNCLQVITDHPAEQAMLARIKPEKPQCAARFEVFLNGVELANGFHELDDATEQRRRFEADNQRRGLAGLPTMEIDTQFLTALEHGLPDCCGVAVGLDRVLMQATGCNTVAETISFLPGG